MRLAHVTATFPPYVGGTGTFFYHNAVELARLGHDLHIFMATVVSAPLLDAMDVVTVHRLHLLTAVHCRCPA